MRRLNMAQYSLSTVGRRAIKRKHPEVSRGVRGRGSNQPQPLKHRVIFPPLSLLSFLVLFHFPLFLSISAAEHRRFLSFARVFLPLSFPPTTVYQHEATRALFACLIRMASYATTHHRSTPALTPISSTAPISTSDSMPPFSFLTTGNRLTTGHGHIQRGCRRYFCPARGIHTCSAGDDVPRKDSAVCVDLGGACLCFGVSCPVLMAVGVGF